METPNDLTHHTGTMTLELTPGEWDALERVVAQATARRAKHEKLPHFRCDRRAREWEAEQGEEVAG